MYSSRALALTLTYAGDVMAASVFDYSHVQGMLKRLRNAGYSVRYIVAGEYGSRKGRVHWHMVLFFTGEVPEIVYGGAFNWERWWPFGHVQFQEASEKGFRYIMKYLLKRELQDVHVRRVMLSKKPPLGHQFFMDRADELVCHQLPLHDASYSFLGCTVYDSKLGRGRLRVFWLRGRMQEMYAERYIEAWRASYGGDPPWTPFLQERHLDRLARAEDLADRSKLQADLEAGIAQRQALLELRRRGPSVAASERQLGYLMLDRPAGLLVLYGDGRMHLRFSEDDSELVVVDPSQLPGLSVEDAASVAGWAASLLASGS